MFPYASIHPEVASAATDLLRFDYYRLVDPRDHRVFAYDRDGDRLIEVDGPCYQLWNQDDPCLNCSSRACLTMQDAVFKIEYLDGRVLHVTSVPMDIEGAELVLELIKDVTDSLLVADIEVRDNIEITQMITKFNELAVRDGFTKLDNKTFINNELESLVQAARGGSPAGEAAVVLLDIDGFKQINDTYGHIAGDDALGIRTDSARSFFCCDFGYHGNDLPFRLGPFLKRGPDFNFIVYQALLFVHFLFRLRQGHPGPAGL